MMSYTEQEQYISELRNFLPENSKLGYGNFLVQKANTINVLLVGRSQSGKSTIALTLQNPQVAVAGRGYATTRTAECTALTISDVVTGNAYCLNIIDTPGLNEKRIDATQSRNDDEILSLARLCITEHVTHLHVVCFVSVVGRTHELDTDVFLKLKDFLGPSYSENSMLVLTNCDRTSDRRIAQIRKDMEMHAPTREILDYCKLGVFEYGTVDYEVLQNLAEREDAINRQKDEVEYQLRRVEARRTALLKRFIDCAKNPNPTSQLEAIFKASQDAAKRAVEEELDKRTKNLQQQLEKLKIDYENERLQEWQRLNQEKREQFEKWTQAALVTAEEMLRERWTKERRERWQKEQREVREKWDQKMRDLYDEWEAYHERYAARLADLTESTNRCTIL